MCRLARIGRRVVTSGLSTLSICALAVSLTAAPAAAKPTTPVPVCAGAKSAAVVDVTQDVRNEVFMPARDGHMWATFSYTQHLRIWTVGAHQYCIRKDFEGTWVSVAGLSPGLSGTISDGLTGTFESTEFWEWTGDLDSTAPASGYLGVVDADCTAVGVCADNSYLIVDDLYFPQGSLHCSTVSATLEVDGGEHGHLSLSIVNGHRFSAIGDITG